MWQAAFGIKLLPGRDIELVPEHGRLIPRDGVVQMLPPVLAAVLVVSIRKHTAEPEEGMRNPVKHEVHHGLVAVVLLSSSDAHSLPTQRPSVFRIRSEEHTSELQSPLNLV